MDAHITVSGNVGSDLELFEGNGFIYTRFRLASTQTTQGGEWSTAPPPGSGCRPPVGWPRTSLRQQGCWCPGRLRTQTWTSEGLKSAGPSVGHERLHPADLGAARRPRVSSRARHPGEMDAAPEDAAAAA